MKLTQENWNEIRAASDGVLSEEAPQRTVTVLMPILDRGDGQIDREDLSDLFQWMLALHEEAALEAISDMKIRVHVAEGDRGDDG